MSSLVLGLITRNRNANLRRAVTSAAATSDIPLRIALMFDDDIAGFQQCPEWPYAQKQLLTPRHYYVRAMNKLFWFAKDTAADETDYLVISHDDDEWVRPNWASLAVEMLENAFPDGQGILELFAPSLCGHYITKFSFIEKHFNGRLAYPAYTMYFSDSEMRNECLKLNAYRALNPKPGTELLVHNAYGTSDVVTREVQNAWFQDDREIYFERYPDERTPPKGLNEVVAARREE